MKERINRRTLLQIAIGSAVGFYVGPKIREVVDKPNSFSEDFELTVNGKILEFRRLPEEEADFPEKQPVDFLLEDLNTEASSEKEKDYGFFLKGPGDVFDDDFLQAHATQDSSLTAKRISTNGYVQAGFSNTFIDFVAIPRSNLPEGSLIVLGYRYGDHTFNVDPISKDRIKIKKPTAQLDAGEYTILSDLAFINYDLRSGKSTDITSSLQGVVKIVAINYETKQILHNEVDLGLLPLPK